MSAARRRTMFRLLAVLGVVGLQLLLWAAYYGFADKHLVGDEGRYRAAALAIWQGLGRGPDLFLWPPLQERFLAVLIGPLGGSLILAQMVQTLLLVLGGLLLRQLWLQLDPRPLAANLAALLYLTSPTIMAFGFFLWPEPAHMFLLLLALWLLAAHPTRLAAAALAGAAIGGALLFKSLLSGFWPVLLLLFVRRPWRKSLWQSGAAFLLGLAVVAGPASWQGWQATGRPLVADSSTFNAYMGLTDHYRSDYIKDQGGVVMRAYIQSGDNPLARKQAFRDRIADLLEQQGFFSTLSHQLSYQYFRLFNAKRTLMSQLPGPACAGYQGAYTLPEHWTLALRELTRLHYLLVLVLAAFGIALWNRRPTRLLWVIAGFFAYQLLMFLVLHVKARFLLPMLPFLCGFAASALARVPWLQRGVGEALAVDDRQLASHVAWRWLLGGSLAGLLLLLALGGPWLDQSCAVVP